MAKLVSEIMNREVFSVRPETTAAEALRDLLALGITGAPVLNGDGRPIGVVSLRDLLGAGPEASAGDRMSRPPLTVRGGASLDDAGRLMAERGYHRLVVVDGTMKAVGVVSALDLVRAFVGVPPTHPAAFPHLDDKLGLVWTDDTPLETERVEVAPAGPGVLLLIDGGRGRIERVVWSEAAHDLRTRLIDISSFPQNHLAALAQLLADRPALRFRAAGTDTFPEAQRVLHAILARGNHEKHPARP